MGYTCTDFDLHCPIPLWLHLQCCYGHSCDQSNRNLALAPSHDRERKRNNSTGHVQKSLNQSHYKGASSSSFISSGTVLGDSYQFFPYLPFERKLKCSANVPPAKASHGHLAMIKQPFNCLMVYLVFKFVTSIWTSVCNHFPKCYSIRINISCRRIFPLCFWRFWGHNFRGRPTHCSFK